MVAKTVHLYEDAKLSTSVFACCLVHYKIPHSWRLLQNLLQLIPRTSNRLDLLNNGASSVGVTNCQCSSEEGHIKQKPSTCSKEKQKTSTCSEEKRVIHLSLSIIRSMYLSLSISQSKSISHEVIRQRWIESTEFVLTLPKIHLIPCQAGCLWGCSSNARIHQEQTYSRI